MLKQNKRVTGKEQYYTPTDVAIHCTGRMLDFVRGFDPNWLEPAGGTGQFVEAIYAHGIPKNKVYSFDIEPLHPDVKLTDDFLKNDLSVLKRCVTLTNPPFGRANSLSIPFFNHCAKVSDYIGFLVPKSWRKWSIQNRLHQNFHLVYDEDIETDFIYTVEGRSKGKLSTVFQIWERRDYERDKHNVVDRGYITKTTPENADVSLTVFGRGCGSVKTDFDRIPNTTQMFLKLNEDWVIDAIKTVDFGKFFNNVAFVEALSIKEINFLLNEYRDKVLGEDKAVG